ncbi:MAG: relative of glycosyl transferase family gt*A [Cellvibrio sp.]|jgi:hypothetical protein|nr:relative of glycosyl transferase family gt*A [Cellvibrio sp.]
MQKILFCWELGEDYGYLGKALALARAFADEPAEFYVASKDLSATCHLDWPTNVKFIQAPIWLRSNPQALKASSFAEILLYKGYDSYPHLKLLTDAWLAIFNSISPDVILFDYSPTALLAAAGLRTPKIIVSNPYLTPAPGTSAINLIPSAYFDAAKATEIHQWVIKVINSVRQDYGVAPITTIGDLFIADATFLSGFSATDYFNTYRSNPVYCGSALGVSIGNQAPVWRPGLSQKLLAYLKHRDSRSGAILKILAAMQARALCFYSDCKPEDIEQFSNTSIEVSNTPLDFAKAYDEAATIICHGGQGVVNEALYRGIPLILAPTQAEQYFIAEKIKAMGNGIVIGKNDSYQEIEKKLFDFFSNSAIYEKARFLAEKKFNIDPHLVRQQICNSIHSFLNN